MPGERSGEREVRKRKERERSAEREIGKRELNGERKYKKVVERRAAF
jgi:hypothetical protein